MALEPQNKAETKADTTAVSSYFGAFPGSLSFPQVSLFHKLHLLKAARSTNGVNPSIETRLQLAHTWQAM